jgi:hypothetical protein
MLFQAVFSKYLITINFLLQYYVIARLFTRAFATKLKRRDVVSLLVKSVKR